MKKFFALVLIMLVLTILFAGSTVGIKTAHAAGGYTITAKYEFSGNKLTVRQGPDGWYYHRLCDVDDGNRAFLKVRVYEEYPERRASAGDGRCWALPGRWLGDTAYQTKICEYLPYGGHICSRWKWFRE